MNDVTTVLSYHRDVPSLVLNWSQNAFYVDMGILTAAYTVCTDSEHFNYSCCQKD